MITAVLEARDYLTEKGGIVQSALRLGEAVVGQLKEADEVEISLVDFRGAPSSFFNALLGTVLEEMGHEAVVRRVRFRFDSRAQEFVYRRSLAAVVSPQTGRR